MTTISYTEFRSNLAHFFNAAEDDADEIVVTRGKGRKTIILPLDEFLSLQETAHLLSSKKNRRHLEKSLQQAKRGDVVRVTL